MALWTYHMGGAPSGAQRCLRTARPFSLRLDVARVANMIRHHLDLVVGLFAATRYDFYWT